jgi:hypothetical protein
LCRAMGPEQGGRAREERLPAARSELKFGELGRRAERSDPQGWGPGVQRTHPRVTSEQSYYLWLCFKPPGPRKVLGVGHGHG